MKAPQKQLSLCGSTPIIAFWLGKCWVQGLFLPRIKLALFVSTTWRLETVNHLLKECQFSVSFWNQLGLPLILKVIQSFGLPFLEWLHLNGTSDIISRHNRIPWKTLFCFGLWSLWLNRNSIAYQG